MCRGVKPLGWDAAAASTGVLVAWFVSPWRLCGACAAPFPSPPNPCGFVAVWVGVMGLGSALSGLGVGRDLGFVEVGSSWWPAARGDEHANPQGLVALGDVSPDPSKSPTQALGIILVRAWWWCGSLLRVGIGHLTCSGPPLPTG